MHAGHVQPTHAPHHLLQSISLQDRSETGSTDVADLQRTPSAPAELFAKVVRGLRNRKALVKPVDSVRE